MAGTTRSDTGRSGVPAGSAVGPAQRPGEATTVADLGDRLDSPTGAGRTRTIIPSAARGSGRRVHPMPGLDGAADGVDSRGPAKRRRRRAAVEPGGPARSATGVAEPAGPGASAGAARRRGPGGAAADPAAGDHGDHLGQLSDTSLRYGFVDGSSLWMQWGGFIIQTVVGGVGGLGVWLGFYALWKHWPMYAAPAVGVALAVMLAVARLLRRRYGQELDLLTAVLTTGVGVILTVLPVAFLLGGHV